ncbi:ankyrin repeat domain-containing protein [Arcobacter vandammei]|uniref:ankyrin repeat domain-containing protein n=1 Tax=Arcobacter vandammei TaxID=2782243 RepID=UPI0018DF651D
MFSFFKVDEEAFYRDLFSDKFESSKLEKAIKKGIDINKQDENGNSLLFLLVSSKKYDAIKLLLNSGVDIYLENKFKKTPLDEACEKSDGAMVRFLLENGYDINAKNSIGRTILQSTAILSNEKIFQVLMTYKPDFNIQDSEGKTVLFHAIEGKNINILKDVVNNVAEINSLDNNYQTALFYAVLKDDPNIALTLINHGINVNFLDKNGENVLFNAIIQGELNIHVIEALIKKNINMNIVDNKNRNIIDELLYIVDLQANEVKNLEGRYKFISPKRDYLSLALLFIENGLQIDTVDDNGKTTLQKEIENKNFANADFLIKCGANVNITDENNRNIIFNEILKGYSNYKMIDFLMARGANIDIKDIDEKSVIDIIVELIAVTKNLKKLTPQLATIYKEGEKYDILLKKVLTCKPNINIPRLDGTNILFDLVLYNDFETLKIIANYGINLNAQDKKGRTPLAFMVEDGLNIREKKEKDSFFERLVNFLKYRVSVDVQDIEGRTVIHKAVIANDIAVVEKLLTKKANLSLKDIHGRTALHHTQWKGNFQIARWLIAAGADINQPDNSGFTILNYAAIFGHAKLIMTLVAAGVLMYNKNVKNRKVAQFFKDRERNLDKMVLENSADGYVKSTLESVVENLKKEVNEALAQN